MYNKAFHGFGFNPIVYEYMKEHAKGFCDCKETNTTINAMNECIKKSKASSNRHVSVQMRRLTNAVSVLLFLFIT